MKLPYKSGIIMNFSRFKEGRLNVTLLYQWKIAKGQHV